ncbi:hypothetical protein D9M72_548370 [compost metagenome]
MVSVPMELPGARCAPDATVTLRSIVPEPPSVPLLLTCTLSATEPLTVSLPPLTVVSPL